MLLGGEASSPWPSNVGKGARVDLIEKLGALISPGLLSERRKTSEGMGGCVMVMLLSGILAIEDSVKNCLDSK